MLFNLRSVLINLREAGFSRLAALLWSKWLPETIAATALAALFAAPPRRGVLSRQIDLLILKVASAAADGLRTEPAAVGRLIRATVNRGAVPLFIAGDSHSRAWVHASGRAGAWTLPILQLVTGASARGLGRSESRTAAGRTIEDLLDAAREAGVRAPLLLVFGQVDVEFIHVYKRLEADPPLPHDPEHFEAFCEATVAAYVGFAQRLHFDVQKVAIASIFPPALSDLSWRAGYVNAHIGNLHGAEPERLTDTVRRTQICDWQERTRQHARFNALLQAASRAASITFVDVANDLPYFDDKVSPALLGRAAGSDHHLDREALKPFTAQRLWSTILAPV